MAELKINENEIVSGSVDEIIDYLNKRSKKQNTQIHKYIIEKDSNIKLAIIAILDHYNLENEKLNKCIEVINIGSDRYMAYKLIKEIMECVLEQDERSFN